MRKKIAFTVAIPGTASAFLKDHITRLVQEYDVHLLANFSKEEEKEEFCQMGVTCHCIPIQRKISIWSDMKALLAIRKVFRHENFESVHSVTPKAALLTALAGWQRCRIVSIFIRGRFGLHVKVLCAVC